RHVRGAAPELDAGLAGEIFRQDAELRFRDAPDAPRRLGASPRALSAGDVAGRFGVPAGAVTPHVLRQHAVVGHVAIYARSPTPALIRRPRPGGPRAEPGARDPHSS